MLVYFALESINTNKTQVLTAVSYLRGEAQHWIRPKLQQWLGGERADPMFASFKLLNTEMKKIYGLSNDEQVAIRTIQHLTQKTSASQYTAKFKEYADKTKWNDGALITMYYRGLKDNVKDELMFYGGDTSNLDDMIKAAIEVDDKLYERSMEKRHSGMYRGRTGYASNGWTGGQQRRDPDAMEIDNIQRKHRGKGQRDGFKGQKPQGKKREGLKCYNCQKIGHFARDCRGEKRVNNTHEVRPQQQFNMMLRKDDSPAPKNRGAYDTTGVKDEHASLHWTFCYDDSCTTHYSSKVETGRWPRQPRWERKQQQCNTVQKAKNEEVNQDNDWEIIEVDGEDQVQPQVKEEEPWYRKTNRTGKEINIIERAQDKPHPTVETLGLAGALERTHIDEPATFDLDNPRDLNEEIKKLHAMQEKVNKETPWTKEASRYSQALGNYASSLLRLREKILQREEQPRETREFNMMQPRWQEMGPDDRGRSPSPYRREDTILHDEENIPPLALDQEGTDPEIPETQELELLADMNDSDALDGSTPEESSDEYSDDEGPDDSELYTFTVDAPEPVRRMVTHIIHRYEEIFPVVKGKRRLNPDNFDTMIGRLRAMFWRYRKINIEYDAKDFVIEKVPIGSNFQNDGSYYAPDGTYITRQMRDRVRTVGLRYREIQHIQDAYSEDLLTFEQMKTKLSEAMVHWSLNPTTPPGLPLPVWRGIVRGNIDVTTRGQVKLRTEGPKTYVTPRYGPLSWEVCMEEAKPTARQSGKGRILPTGAAGRN